jgi:glycine oxidase
MKQIVIVGGGVIGLSIAYELSQRQHRVTVLDTQTIGRKSSWAGAGIITPSCWESALHPLEKLEGLSATLHKDWHRQLLTATQIDNEYWNCGGLYLARTKGESAALAGQQAYWLEREIESIRLTPDELSNQFPALRQQSGSQILLLPSEAQVRNPFHISSLRVACELGGVQIFENIKNLRFDSAKSPEWISCQTSDGSRLNLPADDYCFTAGAWTGQLLAQLQITLPITPVRGQMVLFKLAEPLQTPIINEGSRYLVPRKDGHVLVGATVEEVGFDESTTSEDIEDLTLWAHSLIDRCHWETKVGQWAGLRPASSDGFPYLGRIGQESNLWVATGHFKSGLHLSTGTAVLMADLIEGREPLFDLSPFSPLRGKIYPENPG